MSSFVCRILLTLACGLIVPACTTPPVSEPHRSSRAEPWIVGAWEGKAADGSDWIYVFTPSGALDMQRNGVSYFEEPKDDPFIFTYSCDLATTPARLVLFALHRSGRSKATPGIVAFEPPDNLRIRFRNDGTPPVSFDETAPGANRVARRIADPQRVEQLFRPLRGIDAHTTWATRPAGIHPE
jgi:hypothetical protein